MKRVEGIPEYLYHYTDLKTLKLILMNKTLRLTSLKHMDDSTEALSSDGNDLGKYIFSSSWTEEGDNIPQWVMYGDSSRGVCIKMESFPFKNNFEEYKKYADVVTESSGNIKPSEMFITPPKYFFKSGFHLTPLFIDDSDNGTERRLNAKVEYTDQDSLIIPNIINTSGGDVRIDFGKLGVFKNKQWSFQKEWRYKVLYTPFKLDDNLEINEKNIGQVVVDRILSGQHPIVDYIDYNIDEKYLNTMVVIAGAMMDDFDFMDLEIFCKGINPNIIVKRSKLFNKWKNKAL